MKRNALVVLGIYFILAVAFYSLESNNWIATLFRSTGIAGFTFLAFSLLITPLAMFVKQLSRYVAFRTDSGVFGAVLVAIHAGILLIVREHFNIYLLTAGLIALVIYIAMALTSGASMMKKIGFEKWKMIHRLGYIALPLAAYHAIVNYPHAFTEPFGLIMVGLIVLAVVFQVAGFLKRVMSKG